MTRFVRSRAALWRRVGGEVLLAAPGRPGMDELSESAGAVWTLLEKPMPASALVAALSEAYGVPPGRIAGQVDTLLQDLVARGWLEEAPGGEG